MPRLIAGLITKPEKWTQHCLGRNKEGHPVQSFDVLRTTNPRTGETEEIDFAKDVRSFSLHGAIVHCYNVDDRDKVLNNLSMAIRVVTGRHDYIAEFNNRPETTFKEIQQVIRLAGV